MLILNISVLPSPLCCIHCSRDPQTHMTSALPLDSICLWHSRISLTLVYQERGISNESMCQIFLNVYFKYELNILAILGDKVSHLSWLCHLRTINFIFVLFSVQGSSFIAREMVTYIAGCHPCTKCRKVATYWVFSAFCWSFSVRESGFYAACLSWTLHSLPLQTFQFLYLICCVLGNKIIKFELFLK